jgi:ubiquitin-protein ligase E3 C
MQSEAFMGGLWEVISPSWLQMFNEPELTVLVSGAQVELDVDDWKRHTRLSGGFTSLDPTVKRFWRAVDRMTAQERAALLKFVTSCERAPNLGFEALSPPFCLHRVPISRDDEKLPSASTCFNQLKLPTYSSEKVMHAKLLTSACSGAGYEMS